SNPSELDVFLARYDPSGALVWAKRAGGAGFTAASGIAAMSDGSSVVLGSFFGSATFGAGEPSETTLDSPDGDVFLARFDATAALAWAKALGGPTLDHADAVTALADGSAIATGWFQNSAVFGAGEPNETVLTGTGVTLFVA